MINIRMFSLGIILVLSLGCSKKPHDIVEIGDINEIEKRIDAGLDINSRNENGFTLLMSAVSGGHLPVVEYLLKKGADVNLQDQRVGTPLHLATAKDEVEIIKLLISYGADTNKLSDHLGETPLWMGVRWGKLDAVKTLLECGADPKKKVKWDISLLHMAVGTIAHRIEMTQLFINWGLDVNAKDEQGRTPLHTAVSSVLGAEVIPTLLKNGADKTIRDINGETPLELAIRVNNTKAIQFLEK